MGLPPAYGGAETFINEISRRLVKKGHEITVYGSKGLYKGKISSYFGVKIRNLPYFYNKWIDFPLRRILSILDVLGRKVDVIHLCGSDSALYASLIKLHKIGIVLTIDGMEWERSSWPLLVRLLVRSVITLPKYTVDELIIDSIPVYHYYIKKLNIPATYIPYGADIDVGHDLCPIHMKLGLQPGKYILFIGRLVKEKGVHILLQAYDKVSNKFNLPLVIVGGTSFEQSYFEELKRFAKRDVIFTGPIYGPESRDLLRNALIYVSPSYLEGTSPAILQAMGCGKCVIVSDIPMNRAAFGNSVVYFKVKDSTDLAEMLQDLLSDEKLIEKYQQLAINKIKTMYSWNSMADKYEESYYRSLRKKRKHK